MESFIDKHYILTEKDADKLDGPYHVNDIVSPNTLLVEKEEREIKIIFRGCIPTNDSKINLEAESGLGYFWPGNIYLLKDSIIWLSPKVAKAIVYKPANQVFIGRYENGEDVFKNLSYTMPQLLLIAYGEVILDHSDTDYPLYKVFKEAERLAKENKKGYWATHSK